MLRVVLDTNVIVSAFLRPAGPPGEVLRRFLTGGFTLVVSPALLAEYTSALGKRRIQKYVPFKRAEREGRIAQLAALADVVDDTQLYHADLRDPDDAIVLAAAAEGRAGYIVTGDEDLLVLRVFETTVIVTPRAFLRHLEA